MARTSQLVQIGKRKIELSNLEKVLFPDDGILKAEIIQYYLKIAPTLLTHAKGRAISLIRFPDGITGERFFQKNLPHWTPDWIEQVPLGEADKKINYILATEEASLVWLANLACLELHQYHSRKPHFDKPDYFVFDLDPPEGGPFESVVEIALNLKEPIESFGYHPFVKTTGGKGLHIVVPIEQKWDFHTTFEAAQDIAKPFVEKYSKTTTLHIKKEARKGKVLVDIYRNRSSQSIVSPYSIRGVPGAPVSMPLQWDELESVKDPKVYNLHTSLEKLLSEGDAWEGFGAYAIHLHTKRKAEKNVRAVKTARTYKTPEQLENYKKKRKFKKTSEPRPEFAGGDGNGFVIHRHHASRLHYDLRLEQDGTLKSWAVPRGLPPRPGIKRLAVHVEDHPMKYLTFEGEIPKGEYGGGMMWIYALGKYEITKEKKDGFYFRLQSPQLNAEYRIYNTKDKDWLLERLDSPQINWVQDEIEPMLASSQSQPPTSGDYIYEVKWDGIRGMISLDEGEIKIRSRNQKDLTKQFPELAIPDQAFRATSALFDAEIVCLEENGMPSFKNVIHRMHQRSEGAIERASAKYPVVCYVFDCLYLDGRPLVNEPLMRRREWLADAIRKDTPYRVSEVVTEGKEFFEAAKKMGLEGIMAKIRDSKYLPGKRSTSWLKIKSRQTADCVIIGYTQGKGNREELFGALQLGYNNGSGLQYVGKVGTGFDTKMMKSVFSELKKIKKAPRAVAEKPIDDAKTVWIEPKLFCEIQYASMTPNGTYREPVFVRLRPDLASE
ncbi:non-homologous end-joining DNA ligase [candidate division KSB1 bacterium]|nr:non-homologous end-joining DNA ligase [candidate division KSB1 bacterium]